MGTVKQRPQQKIGSVAPTALAIYLLLYSALTGGLKCGTPPALRYVKT